MAAPNLTPKQAARNRWIFLGVVASLSLATIAFVASQPETPASRAAHLPTPTPTPAQPDSWVTYLKRQCDELTADKNLRFALWVEINAHWGYNCGATDIEMICPLARAEGYRVACNHGRYVFDVEDHGGKWSVRAW